MIKPEPSGTKRWKLRLITVFLALSPFFLAEGCMRWMDIPKRPPPVDPLVDLHHLKPLFELDPKSGEYFIPADRMNLFRPARFAAVKPRGTYRIFCLGESTTQGEPYSTQTAFGAWMQINLQLAAGESQRIEVINCGGLSYASYRVLAILREVLKYEPDLIVVYVGQNEFLEKRSYEGWEKVPLSLARTQGWLQNLRLVQLARLAIQPSASRPTPGVSNPTQLASEVDALLDYSGGLANYHRDDAWQEPVVAHYRWNLEAMIADCRTASVPIVLMRPVVNLLDCPPMKFEINPSLAEDKKQEFEQNWQAIREGSAATDLMRHVKAALAIDPEHAGALFLQGRLQADAGQWEQAKVSLTAAKDHDVCPLRALTEIQEAVTELANKFNVPLVDAEQLFSDRSPHGIVGNNWLVDHIHPGVEGHQLLGEELAKLCVRRGWIKASDAHWEEMRADAYRSYLSSLGEDYFLRGKQRLEGLILWTQGRAKKVRTESPQ